MKKNLIFTFDDFINSFTFQNVSYNEFSKKLSVLDISDKSGNFTVRSSLDDFLKKVAKKDTDTRIKNIDQYKRNLYNMLVEDPRKSLEVWWKKYGSLTEPLKFYFNMPNGSCLTGDTFMGMTNSKYGRICKNINFENFYNTKKLYDNDSEYVFGLLKAMYEDFKIRNSLAGPSFYDHILKNDYNQIWLDFMMGANKASVFNPFTYKSILNELFKGDTLFAPVMGWNSYQIAFYNSNFTNFISTDVIPSVVDNGNLLHQEYTKYQNSNIFSKMFSNNQKTINLYCCPSEQLDKNHDFISKYQNKVDAVLFSPPYFDLEIYDSECQSFTSFPDYQNWLLGYWEETVKLCKAVMRPNARFGFIISNYRNKDKIDVTISQDMADIVAKYFNPVGKYKVRWSAMSSSRQAKKMKNGNFEDLWLYENN